MVVVGLNRERKMGGRRFLRAVATSSLAVRVTYA